MHSPLDHSFSVACLQVLDQIIEDRKRRVLLEVTLIALQQLPCSIFLLQMSIFGKYCSVYWEIVLYFVLFCLGFSGFCLNIGGAVVHTKPYWKVESSNGCCRILGKFIVLSDARATYLVMCLVIEPDPAEVSCVWSQAKLPDVEFFLFLGMDAHLLGQLWGQCTKSSEVTSVEPGKKGSYLSFMKVNCVYDSDYQRPFSSFCYVLVFLPVFISLTSPRWEIGMTFSLGLLLHLGLDVQLSHSSIGTWLSA